MDCKRIELPATTNKKVETTKEKKVRVVTNRENWQSEYNSDIQLDVLRTGDNENPIYKTMIQQIQAKICGYKSQDQTKELYEPDKIADLQYTIGLLLQCALTCYYCKESVKVIYQHVREPTQWSLERISNDFGHNKGNVEIACLSCNLRRRTMYHERFVFTKQLTIVKSPL
jgi:hypothetical protein